MMRFFMQWQDFEVGFTNVPAFSINIYNACIRFIKFENKLTLISV